jgi:hypothetical protein
VDAIIVPTARPVAQLATAIDLAARVNCALVVLCSKQSVASAAKDLAEGAGVEFIAIDVAALPLGLMPRFESSTLLAGTVFERDDDTWLKRNLGLMIARLNGWERVVFLDDDIWLPRPYDLCDAVRLLDSYDSVGLMLGGAVDNSIVCHAYRAVGGRQDAFLSGGALAVSTASVNSFFPNIYNDDWFFLLDEVRLRPAAMVGKAMQKPHDIYASSRRAGLEELGDCLAEGVFWLLDGGRSINDANKEFWKHFLSNRLRFIEQITKEAIRQGLGSVEMPHMIDALEAAYEHSKLIKPALCVEFMQAWRNDRLRWRGHVASLNFTNKSTMDRSVSDSSGIEKALSDLGLLKCAHYVPSRVREPAFSS